MVHYVTEKVDCGEIIQSVKVPINNDDTYDSLNTRIKCYEKGLLVVHTGRESIKLGPPLTINDEALIEGLDVIIECFKESVKDNKIQS